MGAVIALVAATPAGAATKLPDGRGYELVSTPPDLGDVARVAPAANDGSKVAYSSILAADGSASAELAATTVAVREGSGWRQIDANLPSPAYTGTASVSIVMPRFFSSDFTRELLYGSTPYNPDDQDAGGDDMYVTDIPGGPASWITFGTTLPDTNRVVPQFGGATADLSSVTFSQSGPSLLPGGASDAVYRRDGSGLHAVSVLPDGTPTPGALALVPARRGPSPWAIATDGATVAHGGGHGVSDDGRRAFFTADVSTAPGALFLRDGDHTVALSRSHRTADAGTEYSGQFLGATHDGSVAYFSSTDQLTDAATPGGGIYRYDVATDGLSQVTPDAGDPNGAQISEAMLSDDGSRLYFVAAAAWGAGAQLGAGNVYVYDGHATRLVTSTDPGVSVRRLSRDGRYAIIQSSSSIGGAPNDGHVALYEYDDSAGSIACASCRPDGTKSEGDANLDDQLPGLLLTTLTQPRNITDDGRIFFASHDRIVAGDSSSAADIYEYDHGTVSLLTSGRGDDDAYMVDNSDDGHDVFFLSRDALTPDDDDARMLDLYDARVGGGFSFPTAPVPCRDDDCQGAAAPAPAFARPASTAVGPSGNVVPAPDVPAPRIALAALTTSQRTQLARTGAATLAVTVTGGGRISIRATARIGRRTATAGSATRTVRGVQEVTAHVAVHLTSAARRQLARHGHLALRLQAQLTGVAKPALRSVTLTRAHR